MGTTILTHADGDGICCGAIALSKFPKSRVFFTKPVSLLKDLKPVRDKRIIISDIAVNKRDAPEIVKLLQEKSDNGAEILYFDQHPIPDNITISDLKKSCKVFAHDPSGSSSEVIYRHYQKELPMEREWIAIYGAIADYAETSFVDEIMRNWDVRAIYFEVSTLVLGIKMKGFNTYDAKRKITDVLAKGGNPSDIFGLVKAAKRAVNTEFDLFEVTKNRASSRGKIGFVETIPSFGMRGSAALFAATARDKPVGMCLHSRKGHIDVTIRQRGKKYILHKLAEDATAFVSGSGGGLPEAAGGRIPKSTLTKFLKKFNELMKTKKYQKS